jgi:hypothetical protein
VVFGRAGMMLLSKNTMSRSLRPGSGVLLLMREGR